MLLYPGETIKKLLIFNYFLKKLFIYIHDEIILIIHNIRLVLKSYDNLSDQRYCTS